MNKTEVCGIFKNDITPIISILTSTKAINMLGIIRDVKQNCAAQAWTTLKED
jgi:hypothetical protein